MFSTEDIGKFYLGTTMDRYEYMVLPINIISQAIIQQYNLTNMSVNNKIYIQILKGMYRLPQAGILANQQLVTHLKTLGYYQFTHTLGL